MCVDIISCCFMFNIICMHVTVFRQPEKPAKPAKRKKRGSVPRTLIMLGGKVSSSLWKQINRCYLGAAEDERKAQQKMEKFKPAAALFNVPVCIFLRRVRMGGLRSKVF